MLNTPSISKMLNIVPGFILHDKFNSILVVDTGNEW